MTTAVYPGWRIVFAAMLGMACCTIPLVMASFGLFVRPLAEEFGWSRAAVSGAITAHTLASIVAAPLAGALVDRVGARPVIVVSFLAFSAALAAHAFLIDDNVAMLLALYGTSACVGAGCSPVAYTKLIALWFNRRRGLALGIALSGVGLGAALTPLLVQPVIEAHGWRAGYLALALAPLLVGAPSALLLLRGTPADAGGAAQAREGSGASSAPGLSFATAIRTRAFLTLAGAFILVGAGYTGVASHLIPSLQDRGVDTATAAQVQVAIGVAVIFGRLATGALMDRLPARYVAAGATLLLLLGVVLLLNSPMGPGIWLGAVALGLAAGAEIDVLAYMTGRYFGPERFASLYGTLQASYSLGVAFGPPLVGAIRDANASYQPATTIVVGLLATALVVLLTLPRPALRPAPA